MFIIQLNPLNTDLYFYKYKDISSNDRMNLKRKYLQISIIDLRFKECLMIKRIKSTYFAVLQQAIVNFFQMKLSLDLLVIKVKFNHFI